jgi:hypothetical protein
MAIHAGGNTKAVDSLLAGDGISPPLTRDLFDFGAIIGVAELYDVLPINGLLRDDPWAEGPYCMILRNARLFAEPIEHKGRVGLCELPAEISAVVEERIATFIDPMAEERIKSCVQAIPRGPIAKEFLRPSFRPSRM